MRNRGQDVCIVILDRGDERYCWLFTEETYEDALRALGSWASNPDLEINWVNAAQVSRQMQRAIQTSEGDH